MQIFNTAEAVNKGLAFDILNVLPIVPENAPKVLTTCNMKLLFVH